MSAKGSNPVVSPHQVMAAGFAATGASFVTSRFGVAGTLLGAALTAMIITGGSAVLRAYLETLSGRVRQVPTKLRSRREQQGFDGGATVPGRPDLRDNFVGKMRAALDWFSQLPTMRRRAILTRGLVAALAAFVICLGIIWGTEKVIGNSLSCGLWAECPYGAVPGVHLAGYDGTGAGSTLSGGNVDTGTSGSGIVDRVRQQSPFGGNNQPVFGNPGGGASSASPAAGQQVAPSSAPSSAAPAAGQESASPAAQGQGAPSSASPAAGQ